jgi:hypothetical protein
MLSNLELFYGEVLNKFYPNKSEYFSIKHKEEFIIRLGYLILKFKDEDFRVQAKTTDISVNIDPDLSESFFVEGFRQDQSQEFHEKLFEFVCSEIDFEHPKSDLKKDVYNLDIRLISDRQNLINELTIRRLGLYPYMFDRLDMYWITLSRDGMEFKFYVDPCYGFDSTDKFDISLTSYEGCPSKEDTEMAYILFRKTEAFCNMKTWTENLENAGYFEDGRFPGTNTYTCQHCNSVFKSGTTHEHIKYDNRIIYHHGKMHAAITAKGLEASWNSGFKADDPSLEDQGLIVTPCEKI